jgi:hypothetical protein
VFGHCGSEEEIVKRSKRVTGNGEEDRDRDKYFSYVDAALSWMD